MESDEPLDPLEIERNVKSRIRLAFRKALAELPEIAPRDIASVLSAVHMQDEFFAEGKRLQMKLGTDAVAPRVEQECGAGAWSFMRAGVLAGRAGHTTLSLPTAIRLALRKAGSEMGMMPEEAAAKLLYDALMAAGHIELHEIDEGSETDGQG